MRTRITLMVVGAILLAFAHAHADPDAWMTPPAAAPLGSAESRVNEGLALVEKKDWQGAEKAFREATKLHASLPEAWNGLGYALRMQRQYDESVKSYQEALRLRPDYPQALEYLGEAFVQMGKLDQAKEMLERLRKVDPDEADELEETIARAGQ